MTLATVAPDELEFQRLRQRKEVMNRWLRLASVSLVLIAWEIGGLFTPKLFLQPFHQTVAAFGTLAMSGQLLTATLASLGVLVAGLVISVVVGVTLGLLMGRYARIRWALEPYVNGLYATPTIALLPLLTLWLGLYYYPKVALVVLIAIFPIIKNTFAGVATVGTELLEPAHSMGANELQQFTMVIAPATIPFIMSGLRLGVGRGIVGLVVAEFFTAQGGLGGLIVRYASSFKTAEMFVPIIILITIGYSLTALVTWSQHRLAPWKATDADVGM